MALQLPLDIVSNTPCYGAYAAYRVSTSYTGPTINIRRSSDNATSDFYANPYGQFGTTVNGAGTSLESWLGASTAYVVTWYDQSGKGNHATQTTTSQQPIFDSTKYRVDFTSGSSFFNLPSGTVPQGRSYNTVSGTYISTNSAARTTFISDNNSLESIYDTVMNATVTMNGTFIGSNQNATYMSGSRSFIDSNEFNVLFSFFDGTYTKAGRVHFRQNGNIIDCYQSARIYWTGNVTTYNISTATGNDAYAGASGYGVVYLSIPCNAPYTVTMKHNTIASTTGCWLGAGVMTTNQANHFRRNVNQYVNYWYANDFYGNDVVYNAGNTVTYAYDGSYNYLYVNSAPQGVSPIRSGWNGQAGNECIGRNANGGEYFTGEMYYLFIFKSYLGTNERNHIERGMPISTTSGPIKFSQLRAVMNGTTSTTTISLSQFQTYSGVQANQLISVTPFNGFVLRSGLFMRIYWSRYHGNDPTWFNSNTPNVMGVTATLKNTYCATGGFNNPNTTDVAVGGVAATSVYSVEWTGFFFAPITGTYTFYLASDDSSYLWVGSSAASGYTTANSLINNLYTGPAEKSATMSLTGGTYYPFRLQFGDGGGGEFITFSFAPPSGVRVYEGTGYFFCQSRNVSASSTYQYLIRNGSTEITTYVQGTISSNPATSGYAIYAANPWLPNGYYWIKSAAMPNALQMYVDVKSGGYDFYQITGGTSASTSTSIHSGTALGLELMVPRSQIHWKSIYRYVHTTLGSNYSTWLAAIPVYRSTTTNGGNYTGYAMYDPRLGNSGSTTGSYNGAPDWTCKDGGVWYIRDAPFVQPDGDYTLSGFLGTYYTETAYPQYLTSYGAPGLNDATAGYYTGSNYIVSTNYAGSTLSTITTYFDGSTYERAAPSALYIKNMTGATTNGVYWINLPTVGPTQIYCIMDSTVDGGGWMMAMKANSNAGFTSSTTLSYPGNFTNSDVLIGTISKPSNFIAGSVSITLRSYGGKTYANTMESAAYINDSSGTRLIAAYVGDRANNSSSFDITDTVTITLSDVQFPLTVRAWVWYGGWWVYGITTVTTISSVSSGTTFNYDSSYWTNNTTTLNATNTNRDAGDAKFNTMNYFPSKDMLALWPDIPYNYASGTGGSLSLSGYNNWCWMKNNYNSGTKQTLVSYFSTASNVSFGTAKGVERGTAFSSQAGNQFYGVNFTVLNAARVRWGFAWNNEGDWNSNDVAGGIGMSGTTSYTVSYSGGDFIGCCQDQTGINRSARVEMYIR